MVYFISKCKMLIANDSGPVYMAEAFGVPTLVVVGPTDEIEHPPHGPLNFVVTPKRDSAPVMRGHIVGYDLKEAREQIEEVKVSEVLSSLKILLQNIKV
jgi:ADP-heptose:LPS heptosyltransferase